MNILRLRVLFNYIVKYYFRLVYKGIEIPSFKILVRLLT